jgi:hypothetical protein
MPRRLIGPSGAASRSSGVVAWLAAAALLLVGCGGSEPPSERAATAPTAQATADQAPQVVALEGRLGDASTASDGGEEEVSPGDRGLGP